MQPASEEPTRTPDPTPADADPDSEQTTESDGPIDKLKDAFGRFIASEGDRHGARDPDPSS
jgi:hypothetical protein